MEIEVKNNLGKKLKSLDLDPSIWAQDLNSDLLHQSIHVYLANQRQWTKGTKTRANVNYAGQKLRPQKKQPPAEKYQPKPSCGKPPSL